MAIRTSYNLHGIPFIRKGCCQCTYSTVEACAAICHILSIWRHGHLREALSNIVQEGLLTDPTFCQIFLAGQYQSPRKKRGPELRRVQTKATQLDLPVALFFFTLKRSLGGFLPVRHIRAPWSAVEERKS